MAMRRLAVREENTMVARFSLHQMTQEADEPIRNYGARIKGQANICKYTTPCQNCQADVDYTDEILRDVLVRGLADNIIQLDLLGDKKQDMSLEEMYRFVESKESGKRSIDKLAKTIENSGMRSSSYSKEKKKPPLLPNETCSFCGRKGHGKRANPAVRKANCPAYGKTCKRCDKSHHFEAVCRSEESKSVTDEENGSLFNQLCATDSIELSAANGQAITSRKDITLEHHLFDNLHNSWMRRPSQAQPYLDLQVTVTREDYEALGFEPLKTVMRQCTFKVMADTGCQSSIAGIKAIHRLGITAEDLIPVRMKMHAANDSPLKILGAIILRFGGRNRKGETRKTRQIVYVTDSTEKVYLSREGCIALGLISEGFPTIGEAASVKQCDESKMAGDCHCPRRQKPPPRPTTIPFPATEENKDRLQHWLLDYYKSSTFNTCEHQLLPMMDSPPLKFTIEENATPSACHKAIPVPIHWREQVKAGIDRDVRMGVIEPVPVGEPVTWCHRMVIATKKSGEPRRTVDLQSLNRHAKRETHHTSSPFHQARSVPHGTKKTVCDAWNGYHSVPLHPDDRHYTTFITPWGRYRYCVAPQGYLASGDGYTRRYDEILISYPISHNSYTKCVDDVIMWTDTIEDAFWKAVE